MTFNYEIYLLNLFTNLKNQIEARPLNLGGIAWSGGGVGSPPGGFTGYLPQTRIAYDYDETASSGFIEEYPFDAGGYVISGSLLDNLNHIRYRIQQLENTTSSLIIEEEDGIPSISGIVKIKFPNNTLVDEGGGIVSVTISGGGGSSLTVTEPDNDPIINDVSTLVFPDGSVSSGGSGVAIISISGGTGGSPLTVTESDNNPTINNVSTLVFPDGSVSSGGSGVAVISISGGGGGSLTVKEQDNNPTYTNVSTLVFPSGLLFSNETGVVEISIPLAEPTLIPSGVYNVNLSSQIDGSKTSFTISDSFVSSSLEVFLNGLKQNDYTVTETGFQLGFAPQTGDILLVNYDKLEQITVVGGGGGSSLTVTEPDNSPTINNVSTLVFPSGSVSSGGSGVAIISISGGGGRCSIWHPDVPPASPSQYDDEFNNGSLETKWSVFNPDSQIYQYGEDNAGFYFDLSNSNYHRVGAIYQTVPSGNYLNIYTKVTHLWRHNDEAKAGIFFSNDLVNNGSTSDWLLFTYGIGGYGYAFQIELIDDYNYNNVISSYFNETVSYFTTSIYLHVYVDYVNTLYNFGYSTDGIGWHYVKWNEGFPITASHFGLFSYTPNYTDEYIRTRFRFFRVNNNQFHYNQIMEGGLL